MPKPRVLNPNRRCPHICVVWSFSEFRNSSMAVLGFGRLGKRCFRKELWTRPAVQKPHPPTPPQLLGLLLTHSSRLRGPNDHCDRVRATRRRKWGQTVLATVSTRKKVSYPLPFWVWQAYMTFRAQITFSQNSWL